jgi:hypothetical protein
VGPLDNTEKRKFLTLLRHKLQPLDRRALYQLLYQLRYPRSQINGDYLSVNMKCDVLYGREIWSLILGEKHRLRISQNSADRIFEPKRKEVTRG